MESHRITLSIEQKHILSLSKIFDDLYLIVNSDAKKGIANYLELIFVELTFVKNPSRKSVICTDFELKFEIFRDMGFIDGYHNFLEMILHISEASQFIRQRCSCLCEHSHDICWYQWEFIDCLILLQKSFDVLWDITGVIVSFLEDRIIDNSFQESQIIG